MFSKGKTSEKDKWVRRFTVNETTKHKNGFTIYKITSVLFPLASPEAVSVVSVWKRYSEVQRLHRSLSSLHQALCLRGQFPALAKANYFKRFHQDVIDERATTIKKILEFIAEHPLLFTGTEFVNFLQSGQSAGEGEGEGGAGVASAPEGPRRPASEQRSELADIRVYEAADVEMRASPKPSTDSLESLDSLRSVDGDVSDELSPDLIRFDEPSTSEARTTRRPAPTRAAADGATRTEDGYALEAGYVLNMAARCEESGQYQRAFDYYKSGIEIMLVGVQTDTDANRRALVKQKTHKYLSYAEAIYKNHLSEHDLPEAVGAGEGAAGAGAPRALPAAQLAEFRLLAARGGGAGGGDGRRGVLLVARAASRECYAIKVIEKVPDNSEFDEYSPHEDALPVLPVAIPYMVALHGYIETEDLIFLVLEYAPGERLVDYVNRYARSAPPQAECPAAAAPRPPPGDQAAAALEAAVRRWAAELLVALEALHAAGRVWRDLRADNVLLGAAGRARLTYCAGPPRAPRAPPGLCAAPELARALAPAPRPVCDFWSYGAVLYELVCGAPLSTYHRTVFTTHTILYLPDGLPVETQSLLTQLLTYEPSERLGARGADEIKMHPYFKSIDWRRVRSDGAPG